MSENLALNDRTSDWCHPHDEGLSPEQLLVAAMIRHALVDLGATLGERPKLNAENAKAAFWWLFIDTDDGPCSLNWCCTVLGLSRDRIRLTAEQQHAHDWHENRLWRFACEYALDRCPAVATLECGEVCR